MSDQTRRHVCECCGMATITYTHSLTPKHVEMIEEIVTRYDEWWFQPMKPTEYFKAWSTSATNRSRLIWRWLIEQVIIDGEKLWKPTHKARMFVDGILAVDAKKDVLSVERWQNVVSEYHGKNSKVYITDIVGDVEYVPTRKEYQKQKVWDTQESLF